MMAIKHPFHILACAVLVPTCGAFAQTTGDGQLQAQLFSQRRHVNAGAPILVEFRIQNTSDELIALYVPGTEPVIAGEQMGLPLSHVFSGKAFEALTIRNESNRTWHVANGYHPPAKTPVVTLAGHGTIGTTIDVREHYPALRTPGDYRITWAPYGGSIQSNVLLIRVAPLKQAEISTDHGPMTIRFFYEDAPNHVDNFVELAQKGFYNNLGFHRIETGYFIQGGCPNGDGTGIRPDGVKLEAEISDRSQTRGMVSMALVDDDPNSASCQFFICNTRVREWDGRYTVFGKLFGDDSYETLDALMALSTDDEGRPLDRVLIRSMRVTNIPRDQQ
ncbi:MAG: peptidylprolyl isomerase [Phycisphaerae bacterium]